MAVMDCMWTLAALVRVHNSLLERTEFAKFVAHPLLKMRTTFSLTAQYMHILGTSMHPFSKMQMVQWLLLSTAVIVTLWAGISGSVFYIESLF